MMPVRFLDRLHGGDLIIVRAGGDTPLRIQALEILPGRRGTTERRDVNTARKLLRGLIAFRGSAKKK
jgi:hypothetical protein